MSDLNPDPFAPLIGQKAQGCWIGYGSTLFLEFGEPRPLEDRERHPHGEFTLWSHWIYWRIEQGDSIVAGSEDNRTTMEQGIDQINGRVLVAGQISQSTGDSRLEFADHLVLKTFTLTLDEDARWTFRNGDADYLPLGPSLADPLS